MKNFRDTTAAITGAGSGIGRALAINLAQRGASLAISDVDDSGLAETVGLCEGRGVKVTSQHLDVADRNAMFAWADDVADQHDGVNMIVNNAGVTLGATFEGSSIDDFEWLMNINFWGAVHGTQAFLPHLRAAGSAGPEHGHVVNISSVFGLVSIPGQSAYNASKFAVRGFTDALRIELEIERAPVSTTTIHPGGIRPTSPATHDSLTAFTTSVPRPATSPQSSTSWPERLRRRPPDRSSRQSNATVAEH
jgi:NAD(P)-dependent dehydrogenase (short-subunit alcohol dehydrogenase family)